jgi:DNA-binding XRE family transcriptional regulator
MTSKKIFMPAPYSIQDLVTWRKSLKGATQVKLADYLGVTEQTVVRWETGKTSPTLEEANRYIEFLITYQKNN